MEKQEFVFVGGDNDLGFLLTLQSLGNIKRLRQSTNKKDLFKFLAKINPDLEKVFEEIPILFESKPKTENLLEKIMNHPHYQKNIDLIRLKKVLQVHELVQYIKDKKVDNYDVACNKALQMLSELEN